MKTIILFLFSSGLVSAAPNGTIHGQPRMEDCANMPSFMRNDKIVGGQDAPSPIPWQIIKQYGCGGTILDSTTVLSAAHCPYYIDEWIRAGSLKRYSGGQVRKIAQIIENNDLPYNSFTKDNDYVIFKLDVPLNFNNDVQPACLPPSNEYLGLTSSEEQCFTSGWGTLQSGGASPDTCQYVQVPAVPNAACNSAYSGINEITDSMICAGYPEGGKDSCQGDSGGPFVCNNDGKATIAGVVSWGKGCALPGYPGVYSRVTHVLNWIKAQMGETPQPPTEGCGSPDWVGDNFCDDENNNEDCEWDGGDCCGDVNETYCSDCLCLDPEFSTTTSTTTTTTTTTTTATTTTEACEDNWTLKKCKKKKQKGKCDKPKVSKNCKMTCEIC